ncbi:MAG: hypothetical protein A3D65_05270 [Candidatus Lloydbacteria bacterium RIFCSPHIGHO2_02_FULL_50_13]|uniref:Nucleotidyl transferase AbiEii/AbiGii toxin family protein n=1 Tax=Candidatus Lloydbacteria bacterium RIFCSPHIGHO2_02_FULL_50_13 TaxID=1798661 RepID=A0A1G2D9V6_9BACT|nr:MAG: hypothetical protein A3D65_05270 [Candidatus Lloydbacteria bacterium RIFCSPHIGHO2_02_FULL_50_13]
MHDEILTKEQRDLLPFVARFKKEFGLVGGTAIALHIGHRESLDFDLFNPNEFQNAEIRSVFSRAKMRIDILRNRRDELTFIVNGVQMTFFHFPYPIDYADTFDDVARMPTLLTLAAMKAFTLGQRSKWKDYVDLYFILRDYHSLDEIIRTAEMVFGSEFNAKLFRQQLSYFGDVSYQETVIFKPSFEVPDEEIRRALTEYSLA